jgi:hypothetical protein
MTGEKISNTTSTPNTPGKGGLTGYGSNYDQPIFPSVSSAFKRRRGRPRKEEQLQREELTERLIHFLESHYENYRNCSRSEFYNAAAEYLGDVEPGEVRIIFDKLIDAYVESRRRRIHPGRDRHITQWFGRLDNLLHASIGGNSNGNPTNNNSEDADRSGRKRVSTVLEAFIGRGGGTTGEEELDNIYEDEFNSNTFEESESQLAVHKAILRTHLANLQTQQQILETQRQQFDLLQEMFASFRALNSQKLSELNLLDLKLELGLTGQNN